MLDDANKSPPPPQPVTHCIAGALDDCPKVILLLGTEDAEMDSVSLAVSILPYPSLISYTYIPDVLLASIY